MKNIKYILTAIALIPFINQPISAQCGNRQLDANAAGFLKMVGYRDLSIEELRQIPMAELKLAGAPVLPYPKQDMFRIKVTKDSIPILVFNADKTKKRPVIVNYHGGGFISPLIPALERELWLDSKTYDAVVFAVDYRVAPENQFPAAVDDSYNAFKWIAENAGKFGGNRDQIVLMGKSAGANLAAVVAQRAKKDHIGKSIKLHVMNGLPADLRPENMETSSSYQENAKGFFQTKAACYYSVELYAPTQYANAEASPLLADDFSGLPPALIINAEFDPLRDDGVKYAEKLRRAGVKVTEKCFPGQIHCLIGMPRESAPMLELVSTVKAAMAEAFK